MGFGNDRMDISDLDSPMSISFGRFISDWFRSLMRLVEIEFGSSSPRSFPNRASTPFGVFKLVSQQPRAETT